MKWSKKQYPWYFLGFLFVLLLLSFFVGRTNIFPSYQRFVFFPFQKFRSALFNFFPFSIGDIIYVLLVLAILFTIIRIVYFLFRRKFVRLKRLLFRSLISLLSIYLLYFFGWGANYHRPKIWVPTADTTWTQAQLIALNDTLVKTLNSFSEHQSHVDLKKMNAQVRAAYIKSYGSNIPEVAVKPTLFGSAIYFMGVQGYYDPLTGEAQFVKQLPSFMWPFVMAHEMAHQLGIAAEGEANFMAYTSCVESGDPELLYSAYFNLFLYANGELSRSDSASSQEVFQQLSVINVHNIDTLEQIRKQYQSSMRGISLAIYNWMLRAQGQDKGLRSYSEISKMVFLWEKANRPKMELLLR